MTTPNNTDVIARVKQHLKRHRTTYIAAGTTAATVFVFTRLHYTRKQWPAVETFYINQPDALSVPEPTIASKQSLGVAVSFVNSCLDHSPVTIKTVIKANRQGPPSWVVRCLETGEIFSSQRAAAEAMGISRADLSSHLTGKAEDARGYHFERLGLAA